MIQTIQQNLMDIYALPESGDIRQFLIGSEILLQFTKEDRLDPEISEKILLKLNKDASIDIGLFLREDIFKNLKENCPKKGLDEKNFPDFCALVEGVSHFLFLHFRNHHTLPLSALELEIQGELDKFITCFIYRYHHENKGENPARTAEKIHHLLFQQFHFRTHINENEKERYQIASHWGAKLCHHIKDRFLVQKPDWQGLFSFLRRFYRQGLDAKQFSIHKSFH